jgi:hypothetical protein
VSKEEKERASAELEVADAAVAEAKAQANLATIAVRQAGRRCEALKKKSRVVSTTIDVFTHPAEAPPAEVAVDDQKSVEQKRQDRLSVAKVRKERETQSRIDDLEEKLDRVLKEIEAMRKEQANKPAAETPW